MYSMVPHQSYALEISVYENNVLSGHRYYESRPVKFKISITLLIFTFKMCWFCGRPTNEINYQRLPN